MKKLFVGICLLVSPLLIQAQEKEYQLVWSDEFDVEGEPSTEWSYESGFVRNEELQWYQSQNAKVKDGCLVIEAKKGFFINPHYEASSCLKTFRCLACHLAAGQQVGVAE